MQCPLLMGRNVKQCGAVKAIVVLSIGQLEIYCESGQYKQCPVYGKWKSLAGKNIGLAEYCKFSEEVALNQ